MIITKLQGGLGNQLFQWAYGEFLSKKYLTPSYLDLTFYQNQLGVTKREFSLNKLPNIVYKIFPNNQNINNWSNEKHKTKLVKLGDNFHYNKLNYEDDSHYYLDGYWQSEKYFIEIEHDIRKALTPLESTVNKLKERYPTEKSISLHIRRTDYITSNGIHPTQDLTYYKNAIDIIGNYNEILIFSDDINWCKNNTSFKNSLFIENQTDIEDLFLMSLCTHNIIANSSFSWWSAWLNSNPNKIVVAPKNWFGGHSNLNDSDIIPENWIKL